MSIFFDDGGVGSNGQTGWWIAEEESFGESCLLWCPGGLIKGAESPLFQAFPQASRNIPSADTLPDYPSSSSFHGDFLIYPRPSMGQAPYLGRSTWSLAGDWLAMARLHELVRGGSSRAAERCCTGLGWVADVLRKHLAMAMLWQR